MNGVNFKKDLLNLFMVIPVFLDINNRSASGHRALAENRDGEMGTKGINFYLGSRLQLHKTENATNIKLYNKLYAP